MFSSAKPYKNQHYSELKKECIRDKKLFEDPEFPATSTSLYFRKAPPGFVEWKRPKVSVNFPQTFNLKPPFRFSRSLYRQTKLSVLLEMKNNANHLDRD